MWDVPHESNSCQTVLPSEPLTHVATRSVNLFEKTLRNSWI